MRRNDRRDDSHDLLNHYLQEIAKIPRLTPEREQELGRLIQQNDRAALEELVKANLRFVVSYAKRYRNSHVLFLDLINEGNIGLIHAAKKFDPDKNVKFITYAVWWIRQSILHALSEQGGAFRLPPKRANLMYRLEKAISTMVNEQNRIPTPDELALDLGVTAKEIQTLLRASHDSFSLSSELGEESHTELADLIEQTTIPSAEFEMEEQSIREELLHQMAELSPKERLVLTLRHGVSDNIPRTIAQVAEFLGRSVEEIRTTLAKSLRRICDDLEIDESELATLLLFTNPHPRASITYWEKLGDLSEGDSRIIKREKLPYLEKLKRNGSVQRSIEQLPIEGRTVVKLRFGILQDEELTLRDIGEILNLSRERVRQIEARAEAKCRRVVRRDITAR
ncbi:MAG TPA: sigma-70 family RNA polymerase sigma factor [Thermoanaerobaculia bacterium]|nr:sigma-70 family RNA polymerase sigma factor [Thermoanaerobaculia bacterium]